MPMTKTASAPRFILAALALPAAAAACAQFGLPGLNQGAPI